MWFTLTSILCFSGAYILSDSFKNIINSSITNIISYGLDVYVYITIKIKPYTDEYYKSMNKINGDRYEAIQDSMTKMITLKLEDIGDNIFDYIIHKKLDNDYKMNCVISNDKSKIDNYELSNIKFISLTIIIKERKSNDDVKVQLKLHNDVENYYIINNTINSDIVWYLLNKQESINKDDYECEYNCILIDNKAKIVSFNNNKKITIYENSYTID